MADIKFSCSNCGQHIACDDAWAGQQIQCPACQNPIQVPHLHAPAPVSQSSSLVPQPPAATRPKLSAGATQVARSTPVSPAPTRRPPPRPPKTQNPALKYTAMTVLLLVLGLLAYNYLPGLLNQVQDIGSAKTSGSSPAPPGGGVGPMGEVNGAMDVSDALDGNSGSRPRAVPARPAATNTVVRPPTKR